MPAVSSTSSAGTTGVPGCRKTFGRENKQVLVCSRCMRADASYDANLFGAGEWAVNEGLAPYPPAASVRCSLSIRRRSGHACGALRVLPPRGDVRRPCRDQHRLLPDVPPPLRASPGLVLTVAVFWRCRDSPLDALLVRRDRGYRWKGRERSADRYPLPGPCDAALVLDDVALDEVLSAVAGGLDLLVLPFVADDLAAP